MLQYSVNANAESVFVQFYSREGALEWQRVAFF